MEISPLFIIIEAKKQVSPLPPAESMVLATMVAIDASTPRVLPPLKPIQPNHRIMTPMRAKTRL